MTLLDDPDSRITRKQYNEMCVLINSGYEIAMGNVTNEGDNPIENIIIEGNYDINDDNVKIIEEPVF